MAIRTEAASSRLNVQSQVARGESQAVVSKFERMERRIDEMEARADLGQSDKALAQQFAELEVDDQISRELEAMRQKLGQGDSKSEGKQGSNRWKICWAY